MARELVRSRRPLPAGRLLALAVGAMAVGAVAIGALAIGQIAIGRLAIRKARFGSLEVDELTVGRLRVREQRKLKLVSPGHRARCLRTRISKTSSRLFHESGGT